MNLRVTPPTIATMALIPIVTAISLATATVGVRSLAAQSPTPPVQEGADAPRAKAAAKAAFKEAVTLHKAIRGLKGVPRREAQERAAAAFMAVADGYPTQTKLAGRAIFRAAQLYEHVKDRERGVKCLKRLFTLDTEPLTQARGHNLLGHIYRRARNLNDAVKEYTIVTSRYPQSNAVIADTLGWLGKCQARLGDQSAARATWRSRIERFSTRDALVIETHDWIACSFFREGQKDKAKAEVDACRARFADTSGGDAKRAARIERRLGNMRILRLMAADQEKAPSQPSSGRP